MYKYITQAIAFKTIFYNFLKILKSSFFNKMNKTPLKKIEVTKTEPVCCTKWGKGNPAFDGILSVLVFGASGNLAINKVFI